MKYSVLRGGGRIARALALFAALAGCGSSGNGAGADASIDSDAAASDDASPASEDVSGDGVAADAADGAPLDDGGATAEAASDGAPPTTDDASLPADRFVTGVVSFTPGPCAGYGQSEMPGIVEGPPHGGGLTGGSTDVVSLGVGGQIVLSFAPNAIVDGPGVDFIVFENPFDVGGNPLDPYAEPGEVSVSEDGVTWSTYPCTATSNPYGECAGWHVVYSSPGNGISPVDPSKAGGDQYDLAELGLKEVRYVRIVDKSNEVCPDGGGSDSAGFDLDAIAIVNAAGP